MYAYLLAVEMAYETVIVLNYYTYVHASHEKRIANPVIGEHRTLRL